MLLFDLIACTLMISSIPLQRPATRKLLPLNLPCACAAVRSNHWEVQYFAVAFVAAALYEEFAAVASKAKESWSDKKTSRVDETAQFSSPSKKLGDKNRKVSQSRSLSSKVIECIYMFFSTPC